MEQKYYNLELTEQELFTIFCLIEDERDNILESIRENPELVREDYIQDSLENTKDLSDYIISVLDEEDEEDYEDEDETEESEFAEQLVNFDFTDEFSEVRGQDEQEYNDEDYLATRYSNAGLQKEIPAELDKILKQLKDSGLKFEVINLSDLQKNSEETTPLSETSTAELKQKLLNNLSPEEVELVARMSFDIQNMMGQFKLQR